MPNSQVAIYLHVVFTVKERAKELTDDLRPRVLDYIGGIVRNRRADLIAAGGVADHVQLAIRMPSDLAPADLIRDIKANTTNWLRREAGVRFAGWQDGSGMFSVSKTHVDALCRYILNQEEHHRVASFREELLRLFELNGVELTEQDRRNMGLD